MVEAQTIRVQIARDDRPFTEVDVQVHPWHIGNYGGDWTLWLRHVAPEWVDRMASGIRDEQFHAVAADTATGQQLATVDFTHSTSRTVTVTVENTAAAQLSASRDGLPRLPADATET